MKAFMQKHLTAAALALSLLILTVITAGLFAQSGKGTYAVFGAGGDMALLKQLELPLVQYDDLHEQELMLTGGELQHRFRNRRLLARENILGADTAMNVFTAAPAPDSRSVYEESSREVYLSGGGKETINVLSRTVDKVAIIARVSRSDSLGRARQVSFDTGVTYDALPCLFTYEAPPGAVAKGLEELPFYAQQRVSSVPDAEMGIGLWDRANGRYHAQIGNTHYAAAWVGPGCGGTAGLFRIDEWGSGVTVHYAVEQDGYALTNLDGPDTLQGQVTRIASYPAENTRTLNLYAIDNKLYLLLIAGDTLTLRAYDTDGTLLCDAPLCPLAMDTSIQSVDVTPTTDGETVLAYRLMRRAGQRVPASGVSVALYERMYVAVRAGDGALLSRLYERDGVFRAEEDMPADRPTQDAYYYYEPFAFAGGRWVFGEYSFSEGGEATGVGIFILDETGAELAACSLWTDAWEDGIVSSRPLSQPPQRRRLISPVMQELRWR